MVEPKIKDGVCFLIGSLGFDKVTEMKGFKPELKEIHCAGLFNTLGIPVQFTFLTTGIGFFAEGLTIHTEPQFKVAVLLHLVIMVDQCSVIIHPQ